MTTEANQHRDHLWKVDLNDFIGNAHVIDGGAFDVDGRDEEHTHIFDWDDFGPVLWAGEREGDDYEIVQLVDFEPTTVVLRIGGETVGFYMDAISWIDEAHRGRGLSVDMIRAGIGLNDEVPDLNTVGFTPAGWHAHKAAFRASVDEARARGDLPPIKEPEIEAPRLVRFDASEADEVAASAVIAELREAMDRAGDIDIDTLIEAVDTAISGAYQILPDLADDIQRMTDDGFDTELIEPVSASPAVIACARLLHASRFGPPDLEEVDSVCTVTQTGPRP